MTRPSDKRAEIRADRSRRGVQAAVDLARSHGLRVEEPTVLADLFSVMVHLRPAPVVARVSTWTADMRPPIADWLAREIAMTEYLAGQGAPVVAPSRELPPGPYEHDGFAISFWTYIEPDPDREPTVDDCAAMLVDLHAAMRTYPGDLPVLAPAGNEIPRGLAVLDRADGLLSSAEIDRIQAAAERLRPFWAAPGGDLQPVHGDVHPGNLIATRDGLVWIDFEDVSLGPVEWDLSLLSWSAPEVVATYHRPDPEMLSICSDLRALHLTLCLIAYRPDLGDLPGWDDGLRGFLNQLSG